MDFIICQVGRLTGNIDGIFNRNILQNIQIPQFTANMLCGKALEDTKKMLAFSKYICTRAHRYKICLGFGVFFCPEVRVLRGERGGIPSNLAFFSSLVTKAFRLQGYINPSVLFLFFANEAESAFAAVFPMENITPCSGNECVCHSPASCCYSPGPSFPC